MSTPAPPTKILWPHSSATHKDLMAALPHTHFQPIKCTEEETHFTGPTIIIDEKRAFRRRDRQLQRERDIHALRGTGQGAIPKHTSFRDTNPREQEASAPSELTRPRNESSTESSCSTRTLGARHRAAQTPTAGAARDHTVVTKVPVDNNYEYPRTTGSTHQGHRQTGHQQENYDGGDQASSGHHAVIRQTPPQTAQQDKPWAARERSDGTQTCRHHHREKKEKLKKIIDWRERPPDCKITYILIISEKLCLYICI